MDKIKIHIIYFMVAISLGVFKIPNVYATSYTYGPVKLYYPDNNGVLGSHQLHDTIVDVAWEWCAEATAREYPYPSPYRGCMPASLYDPVRFKDDLRSLYFYVWLPNLGGPGQGAATTPALSKTCPTGGGAVVSNGLAVVCRYETTQVIPDKNNGGCDNCAGNPINTGTGNKYQIESDFPNSPLTPWKGTRYYNSQKALPSKLGKGWNIFQSVRYAYPDSAILTRPDNKAYTFILLNGVWKADADVQFKLSSIINSAGNITGWKVITPDDEVEMYDGKGLFISYQTRSGIGYSITWNFNGNSILTDSWGRTYLIKFANDKLESITDPASGVIRYTQDAGNRLVKVTHQDNKERQYHYEDSRFPDYLTGITDENGVRYATWKYDNQGRAYSSEHGVGVDKYQISFGATSSTIKDPLNTSCTTNFTTILGVIKSKGQAVQGSSGCGPAASSITYDDNGNVKTRTDFKGNLTTYTYDLGRNLETSRTEAVGKPETRTISLEWHPTYRLVKRMAEPLRITSNEYDDKGNLSSRKVQATTDANGSQSFAAILAGAPRIWTYTYNQYGQVLTVDGPLSGEADKITYTYDGMGNLATVTNAKGHVTTLSNYDLNGRVGRITDPNGLITSLSYSPRGWLTSKVVTSNGASEATTYDYDGVGQMTQVTLPDSSYISYTYDDAHRLTDISDSLGNHIHYVLDNIGNRLNEQVKDPNGALSKQVTRIYDALNRLQQVTGSVQ